MADLDKLEANQDEKFVNGAATQEDSDRLKDLIAQATLKYSVKDYEAAAELYAFATELQAEINGEMSPGNADLLYAYGRCLYHVAVKNSDVLGSKVAGEARDEDTKGGKEKQKSKQKVASESANGASSEVVTDAAAQNSSKDTTKESETGSKPYFQFTGDENFDTSDEDEVDNGEDGEGAEEAEGDEDEDDFVVAYEVLDLARVLLQKKIEEVTSSHDQTDNDKGKQPSSPASTLSTDLRRLNERLADTYDLQAEISLEGERFPSAVIDLRSALTLKQTLYPQESSLIAEAHFKLSLALEFSSVTQAKDANGEVAEGAVAQVDEKMREEAAVELESAIASCRLRIAKEEARLAQQQANGTGSGGLDGAEKPATATTTTTKADIDDVKEMVKDLQQRVTPPLSPCPVPLFLPPYLSPHLPSHIPQKLTHTLFHISTANRNPPTAHLNQQRPPHLYLFYLLFYRHKRGRSTRPSRRSRPWS